MNVKNCRKCRRIFNYVMGPILCPNCREAEEAKFQEVKKYVQENRRCGMQEVSEACDVSLNQIQQWLREERLVLADDSPIGIGCEKCGKIIRGGRFCPECVNQMTNSFQSTMSGMRRPGSSYDDQRRDTRDGNRMRFLNK
ncbi:MAG: flagellar protein [Lachnospiraceae bacterium]|nr:flagellar protein [Lachnospiraceae bacterium]